MNSKTKLGAALAYASRGWLVLPLKPNAKIPLGALVPHGLKDATTSPAKIREWWTAYPDANVGLATGAGDCGPYVLDIDAQGAEHKHDGAASLKAAGVELPATLTAKTANGGRHFYFGLPLPPAHDTLHSCANLNGLAGVDVRAAGGYVVAPPSVVAGKPYEWLNYDTMRGLAQYPSSMFIKPKPTAVATPQAVQVGKPTPTGADATDRARAYLATCDAAISGQGGHVAALHAAHALVIGFGLDDATALDLLLSDFNPRCVPPWTEGELRHKLESARANPQKPVGYLLDAPLDRAESPKATAPKTATATATAVANADDRYSRRRLLSEFSDPMPETLNPDALFDGGWLRRGGAVVFVSVSGAGKSVAVSHASVCFALGREWFGIKPVRPLTIAVYEWEDDETEVADFRNNIRSGLLSEGWTRDEITKAEARIVYHDVGGISGASFIAYLAEAQERDRADLVIINPLQSCAACDIQKNSELSRFLRGGIDPILKSATAPCGCLLVHHTNKPPSNALERKHWLDDNGAAYAGAGGAELVNWARAVLLLRPHEVAGYYDLVAAKRGKRLGWKDAEGNPTGVKHLAHSAGIMYWREPDAEELAAARAGAHHVNSEKRRKVIALVEANGKPYPSETALVLALDAEGLCKATAARKLIAECVRNGELVKRSVNGCMSVATPLQVLDAACDKTDDDGMLYKDGERDDDLD